MTFDSPEWRKERNCLLLAWMQEDHNAYAFILQLGEVAEVWDDLIDGDPVTPERIHGAFITALFAITGNPFFTANAGYLRPLMLAGTNAWLDSVDLERRGDNWAKVWAYALRDWYMELVPACAFLVGGYDHMRLVSLEAREFFQKETLQEFLDGHHHPISE